MKDDISHLFKNVFIGSMLLINISLILYVISSSFVLDIKIDEIGGFWGSLLGAFFTGLIAIAVFVLGKVYDRKKSKEVIENYKVIISKVHSESIKDFKVFLRAAKKECELPSNYRELILRMLTRGKIFDLVEVNGLIKETDQAIYIINYMIIYNEAVKLIDSGHGNYGNAFFTFNIAENNKSNVEWLEEYINNMEKNVSEIK